MEKKQYIDNKGEKSHKEYKNWRKYRWRKVNDQEEGFYYLLMLDLKIHLK